MVFITDGRKNDKWDFSKSKSKVSMESPPILPSSTDKQPRSLEEIEKTLYGAFLKLRDGKVNLAEYEATHENPMLVIKAFCLQRAPNLKPPYTLEEVDAFQTKLGQNLDFSLYKYLTEISRETVFGYHRHTIELQVPICEHVLGTTDRQHGKLLNPEKKPSTLLRIANDGCAFSKAMVIKGEFLGSVWALSDDKPELIAPYFDTWLIMGMKRQIISMMHDNRVKEAGGQKEYMEQRRKAASNYKRDRKKKQASKEVTAKLIALRKEMEAMREKLDAKQVTSSSI